MKKPINWIIRYEISETTSLREFTSQFKFTTHVGETIEKQFNSGGKGNKIAEVIYSNDFMDKKVIRIRPIIEADGDTSIVMVLR